MIRIMVMRALPRSWKIDILVSFGSFLLLLLLLLLVLQMKVVDGVSNYDAVIYSTGPSSSLDVVRQVSEPIIMID